MSIRNGLSNILNQMSKPFNKRARISKTLDEFEYVLHTRFKPSDVHYCSFSLDNLKLTLNIFATSSKYITQSFDYVFTPDMLTSLRDALVSRDYSTLLYYGEDDLPCRIDVSIPTHKKKKKTR